MEHQRWIKRSLISAAIATSIGLTACGGGDGDGDSGSAGNVDSTTTLSGIVADGYLVNAIVCLDLNLSKTCDSDEPKATSISGGKYSLDATQAQINTYPIVAEIIAGITVDEDNLTGTPVTKAYTLSTPAGKGAFVSPLTTIVQAQIETTGKTAEKIEKDILASIGQDPTVVSLFDDYVAQEKDTHNTPAIQASYLQLHQIAQVTAATIANNIETIEAAIKSGDVKMDLPTTLDSVITIIVQSVIAELTAIASAIDSEETFNADTISSVVPPVNLDTIEDQVAVVEAPSVDASNIKAIFTNGISWMWAEFGEWGNELERSFITYDAVTGKLSEPIESYFELTTPGWTAISPGGTEQYVLQLDGTWKAAADSWDGSSVTFDNTAGTVTIDANRGKEVIGNIQATNLTDLNIKQFVANKLPDLAEHVNSNAVFTSGSESYSLTATSLSDSYSIWVWDGCDTASVQYVNGSCNTVGDWSSQSPSPYTSLASVPYATAWTPGGQTSTPAGQGNLGRGDVQGEYLSLPYELVQGVTNTSGTVNYYLFNYSKTPTTVTKIGTGTWALTTVNGTELLMVDHPDALMSQYSYITDMDSPEENTFYAIQDNVVRRGDHWPANITEDTIESLLTNSQAQADMTGAFLNSLTADPDPAVVTDPTNAGIVSFKNFSLLASDTQPMVIDPVTGTFTNTDVTMTVVIGDRGNQLLTDSHTIFFHAEYGLINPSCVTVNGSCSVTWSAINRPEVGGPGDDMLVTIIAYTIGEESFTDTNGNGLFDDGDNGFDDLEEPYLDADESNSFTSGDVIVDVVNGNDITGANGVHDIGDGFFNGPGCTHSTLCSGVIITNGTIWNANTLKIDGP